VKIDEEPLLPEAGDQLVQIRGLIAYAVETLELYLMCSLILSHLRKHIMSYVRGFSSFNNCACQSFESAEVGLSI